MTEESVADTLQTVLAIERAQRETADPLPILHRRGPGGVVWQNEKAYVSAPAAAGSWGSAIDPVSGRRYYYHKLTKKSQWDQPDELRDPEELRENQRRQQETLDFFRSMEKNIASRIEEGRETYEEMRDSLPQTLWEEMEGQWRIKVEGPV